MQSFDYISENLGVSPTLNPSLCMCTTLCADLCTWKQDGYGAAKRTRQHHSLCL